MTKCCTTDTAIDRSLPSTEHVEKIRRLQTQRAAYITPDGTQTHDDAELDLEVAILLLVHVKDRVCFLVAEKSSTRPGVLNRIGVGRGWAREPYAELTNAAERTVLVA